MHMEENYRTTVPERYHDPSTGMDVGAIRPHIRSSVRDFKRPALFATTESSTGGTDSGSGSASGSGTTASGSGTTSGSGSGSGTTTDGSTTKSATKKKEAPKAAPRSSIASQAKKAVEGAGGGYPHVYTDGARKGFFQGGYEDSAPVQGVRFADQQQEDEITPRFLLTTRPRVVKSDMQEDLIDYVVQTAQASLDRYKDDIDISCCIKMKLENRFQGCWVAVVGAHYATFVTEDCFQPGTFCYFFIGRQGFLVFKCF